jgi:glutamate formiminotransferase/formiminotetrahydrofolate cyclodeaminase
MPGPILECVPNISEGRDLQKIEAIAEAIRSVPGAHLLNTDASPAANRTVYTFAGAPEPVSEAAFRMIAKAAELIDMTSQYGVHPRIGATDVCPLVPLSGLSMEEADAYANELAAWVGADLNIPVYLYEHSATSAHRTALPDIRKGQYEGLADKMKRPDWAPDYGPAAFNPKTGATIIGARDILVAFNISLDTADLDAANRIAARLRTSGYFVQADGTRTRVPGMLEKTRAIGWHMADYGHDHVSINLLDYRITSPLLAWEACSRLAQELGISLNGSEVIGLLPEGCLLEAGSYAMRSRGEEPLTEHSLLVHEAIRYMGLDKLKPFHPREKVLEYALASVGLYL